MRRILHGFHTIVSEAAKTVWAIIAVALLLFSVTISVTALGLALRSSHKQINGFQAESTCRAVSAVALESANGAREDALADLLETLGRLLDASLRQDRDAVTAEGQKFGDISARIAEATRQIQIARADRLDSVDRCAREN